MDPELVKIRRSMQKKIYLFLRSQSQNHQLSLTQPKLLGLVKSLEDGLFNAALSQEEYLDLDTLESRLFDMTKSLLLCCQNPPPVNSSSSIGTEIPTPGMSHVGNSNLMVTSLEDASMTASSGCNSITPTTVNTGNLLASGSGTSVGMHGGSFTSADGFVSHGYQGVNNMMSSIGVPTQIAPSGKWFPPQGSEIKINTGASAHANGGSIAFVARNSRGNVIGAKAIPVISQDPAALEALAARSAVDWAVDNRFWNVHFESDASLLVQAINLRMANVPWIQTGVIQHIKSQLDHFQSWKWSEIQRSANEVAHYLAKWAASGVIMEELSASLFLKICRDAWIKECEW